MKKATVLGFMAGLVMAFVLLTLVLPNYSDYIASSQTTNWQIEFEQSETKKQIEAQLLANQPINIVTDKLNFKFVKVAKVNALGEVLLKGGRDGQILILTPLKNRNLITWQCLGGSDKAVPSKCRGVSP